MRTVIPHHSHRSFLSHYRLWNFLWLLCSVSLLLQLLFELMELSLEVLRCSLCRRQSTQKETLLFHLLLPVLPLVLWSALMEPHRLNRRLKTEAAFCSSARTIFRFCCYCSQPFGTG